MKLTTITVALLATTALTSAGLAQSATTTTAAVDSTSTHTQTKQQPKVMDGLTASPTDFGTVNVTGNGAGNGTNPDGSTGQDLGGGNMIREEVSKQRSTVTRDAIAQQSPTTNPYQMINLLPGVNTGSYDAAGLNGGSITIRGFTSQQLGLTIEGMPVNDSGSYALYPQEYVDANNIAQVSIAQGTPDLDSPHIGATGGVINIYANEPSRQPGWFMSETIGSYNAKQEFLRYETGQIGNMRGYISLSRYNADHWSGVGTDNRTQVDAKVTADVGDGNHIRFSMFYNTAMNDFYVAPTLAQFNTPGYKPNYNATLTGNASTDTNYFGYRVNPFRNLILSAPSDFRITDQLTYDVIPYFWYGYGNGGGVSTMTEDNGSGSSKVFFGNTRLTNIDWDNSGSVVNGTKANYYNPSVTETYRPGIINKFTYDLGEHRIVAGYWLEDARHQQTAPYDALTSSGGLIDPFTGNNVVLANGAYAGSTLERRNMLTKTLSNELFVGDTWTMLNDTLKLDYGVKMAAITRNVYNYLPGANPEVDETNYAALPTAGISYKLNAENQIYTSVGTTMRITPNYSLADAFSTSTGVKTTLGSSSQQPERAVTGEIGHRFQGDIVATSVALFGTYYTNRQVTTNIPDPNNPSIIDSFNMNAGSVVSYGVDFEAGTRPIFGSLRPYASAEVMQSRMQNNLQTTNSLGGIDYLPTAGKQLPQTPNLILAAGLSWDDGHILGNFGYKYTGAQYSTFMNDEEMPGYGRLDAMLGYRFSDVAIAGNKEAIKAPTISLNLYNLTNARQLVAVNGVQSNAQQTTGINGTTIKSSGTPTYIMGEGFAVMATLKAGF